MHVFVRIFIPSLHYIYILNIILPACRPSLVEVARTTWKVERAVLGHAAPGGTA